MDNANQRLYGNGLFGESAAPHYNLTSDRFTLPPFSVLDGRSGQWKRRRRAWNDLGLSSVSGRSEHLNGGLSTFAEVEGKDINSSTSIFDPVLCEMMYSWFSPKGGQIVDPFAGGCTRGVVASILGRHYWGCDLNRDQVRNNRDHHVTLPENAPPPVWVIGDSLEELTNSPAADFLFTCPPYGDLERYTDDPRDISTMEYHTFVAAYGRIIMRAVGRLKEDRFAAIVVGDFRDVRRGFLRDFVSATIAAFTSNGCHLYNEMILATPLGSAPMRVEAQFVATRKAAKVHQNVLIFCKGSPKRATEALNATS